LTSVSPQEARKGLEFSVAYQQLMGVEGLIRPITHQTQTARSRPKDFFAHASRLAPMLAAGHPDEEGNKRVELDRESWQRIIDWLDLNAQFHGNYSHNRLDTREVSPEGEKALREHVAKIFGRELASQPLEALVNRGIAAESRILKGPLACEAGGWGRIPGGWDSTEESGYAKMRALVDRVFVPLPFRDVDGTCGRDDECRCGNCWIRTHREQYLKTTGMNSTIESMPTR